MRSRMTRGRREKSESSILANSLVERREAGVEDAAKCCGKMQTLSLLVPGNRFAA